MPRGFTSKLVIFIALALAVAGGLIVYADVDDFLDALSRFKWGLAPLILALVLANYALRFLKWHYFLSVIGATGALPLVTSALIFLSGLAMVITPAKAGEFIKSYFLQKANGTPIQRSTPVIFAERFSDGMAVFLLSLAGLFFFEPSYWPFFAVVGLLLVALLAAIHVRRFAHGALRLIERLPLLRHTGEHLEEVYESAYALLAPWPLFIAVSLGLVGWGCEAVGLYLVVYGLTDESSLDILVKSAFIMGVASLAGALFVIPGGLGVSETSIAGLGRTLLDLSRSTAAAATIMIRFFTLWFGVAVGLVALVVVSRRLAVTPEIPATIETASRRSCVSE
ncbi:MAG: lysylphosphatidylglycerol synthase transmembrane domain-containing protein [Dehalococcoidia bacterium]